MSDRTLSDRFTFHPVTDDAEGGGRAAKHERIRNAGRTLAELIVDLVPECPERARAVDAVDDAVMRANAGLARPQLDPVRSNTITFTNAQPITLTGWGS